MVINPIVGVYIPIIRIPIKGGMTIPNIATLDHGTYSAPLFHPIYSWFLGAPSRSTSMVCHIITLEMCHNRRHQAVDLLEVDFAILCLEDHPSGCK